MAEKSRAEVCISGRFICNRCMKPVILRAGLRALEQRSLRRVSWQIEDLISGYKA